MGLLERSEGGGGAEEEWDYNHNLEVELKLISFLYFDEGCQSVITWVEEPEWDVLEVISESSWAY